jgi:hypothetical protein
MSSPSNDSGNTPPKTLPKPKSFVLKTRKMTVSAIPEGGLTKSLTFMTPPLPAKVSKSSQLSEISAKEIVNKSIDRLKKRLIPYISMLENTFNVDDTDDVILGRIESIKQGHEEKMRNYRNIKDTLSEMNHLFFSLKNFDNTNPPVRVPVFGIQNSKSMEMLNEEFKKKITTGSSNDRAASIENLLSSSKASLNRIDI